MSRRLALVWNFFKIDFGCLGAGTTSVALGEPVATPALMTTSA